MPDRRVSRLLEGVKTALILILIATAVYLFGRTQVYANLTTGGWLQAVTEFFSGAAGPASSTPGATGGTRSVSAARPVRVAVTGAEQEGRWGAQYSAENDAFFELAGGLLAEALSVATAPRAVTERAFQDALARQGAYFDFLGKIPIRALCLWLANVENPALGDGAVRRLCLALTGSGGAALYYINETDGLYYTCDFSADLAPRLTEAVSQRLPNGARFAFEAGEVFEHMAPYVLLLAAPPRPPEYTARAPLGQIGAESLSAPMELLLRGLGFNPRLASVYPVTDGVVIREGADTLRVTAAGVVTYRVTEGGESRYPAADPLEAAVDIAEATVGQLGGSARLYLIGIQKDGEQTTVRFGYCLDGAEVSLPGGIPAAEVVVTRDAVSELTLFPRAYEPSAGTAVLLPELQALAAMEALGAAGGELLLRYEDNGQGQCIPVWGVK